MSAGTKNDLSTTHVIVRVFGGMGVDVYGEPISIGGPRQRRLLALLASRAGSVVDIDWLAEYLWDDDDRPEATAPALRTYVSRLRQALPESAQSWLETEPSGYRFSPPDDSVEHRRFARLRAEATRARELEDPQAALALLDEALTLWRGRAIPRAGRSRLGPGRGREAPSRSARSFGRALGVCVGPGAPHADNRRAGHLHSRTSAS